MRLIVVSLQRLIAISPNLALYQPTERHLGILQDRRVKAFGEPVMDAREEIACFGHGVGDGPGAIAAVVCAQR